MQMSQNHTGGPCYFVGLSVLPVRAQALDKIPVVQQLVLALVIPPWPLSEHEPWAEMDDHSIEQQLNDLRCLGTASLACHADFIYDSTFLHTVGSLRALEAGRSDPILNFTVC